ncbi:hypothetical protein [Actinomadura atramentaria]|uniref:hypothetical protein n=1 Tax=Actinomadura atramentaria TaxID=1990 RepID=UPI00036587AA|nr:hypothetical protein [Actinomadura atramentaria]
MPRTTTVPAGPLDRLDGPRDLRRLLDIPGMDDAGIARLVADAGTGVVLDRVFDLLCVRFVPGSGRRGIVQWDVAAPEGGTLRYQTAFFGEWAEARPGSAARARVTLTLSAPTLIRLGAGRLNSLIAVRTGRIGFQGSVVLGARLPHWFAL